jgi:NitT/TauT family transport system permease protein
MTSSSTLQSLAADLAATAGRAAVGLVLGVCAGVAIGVGVASIARRIPIAEGALDFARSIPPVLFLPPFLLAFGWGDVARVFTVATGCAWLMALSVTTAALAPISARAEMLRVAGASRWQRAMWTQPWEALPVLAVGLRSSASMALVVAVVTEMVAGAEHGIGSRMISAQIGSDTTELGVDLLAVGVLGYLANLSMRRLESWARRFA